MFCSSGNPEWEDQSPGGQWQGNTGWQWGSRAASWCWQTYSLPQQVRMITTSTTMLAVRTKETTFSMLQEGWEEVLLRGVRAEVPPAAEHAETPADPRRCQYIATILQYSNLLWNIVGRTIKLHEMKIVPISPRRPISLNRSKHEPFLLSQLV